MKSKCLAKAATLIRVSKSQSSGRMEEIAGDLNISITRAESFEFPGVARLRRAEWRGEAAGIPLSSQMYGSLLFVLAWN